MEINKQYVSFILHVYLIRRGAIWLRVGRVQPVVVHSVCDRLSLNPGLRDFNGLVAPAGCSTVRIAFISPQFGALFSGGWPSPTREGFVGGVGGGGVGLAPGEFY